MNKIAVSRRSILAQAAAGSAGALLPSHVLAADRGHAEAVDPSKPRYGSRVVGDVEIFYREAGPATAPLVLLLHGFPSAGHMYRDLIPHLSKNYRVIAPDLPGFGETKAPGRDKFAYTFANLADVMGKFVEAMGLKHFSIYIFDYGAPVGLRLALAHPEKIAAIVSQNGNAYVEGLSEGWNPIQRYWKNASDANRSALREFLTPAAIRSQYVTGVRDASLVSRDGSNLDTFYISRPGNDEIQLDLFKDYRSNVDMYPSFQAYFRTHRPPLLAVWGKNDPFFLPAGAEAYRHDLPKAEVRFLDTGHFALETHAKEIGSFMTDFLKKSV